MINSIIEEDVADEIRELKTENKRLKGRVIQAERTARIFRMRALNAEARLADRIPVGETS